MRPWTESYPYLAGSLGLLALLLLLLLLVRDQRRPVLWSAALSTPFSFASIMFVPEYWDPVRLVEFGVGVEDLLFSFATGGIAWLLAAGPFRRHLQLDLHPARALAGYALISTAGMAVTAICWRLGLAPMEATLVSVASVGAVLAAARARNLPLALAGAASFGAFYWALFLGLTASGPRWLAHWSHENLWGVRLSHGIPLEEVVWAVSFGAVWPLFMAFVFGARWRAGAGAPAQPAARR